MQALRTLKLTNNKNTLLRDVEVSFKLSKRKTRELATNLVAELNNLLKQIPGAEVSVTDDSICFSEKINDDIFVLLINRLKEQYISSSALYWLLLYVLEKRKFQLDEVSKSLVYSESYSYKLISKLKNFFQVLNTEIDIIRTTTGYYEILGDETDIRLLHYFTIVMIDREGEWPFNNISQGKIIALQNLLNFKQYNMLSPSNRTKSNFMLAVYINAIDKGYTITELGSEVLELWESIFQEKDIVLCLRNFIEGKSSNKEIYEYETIHFSFYANYLIPELTSRTEKINIGMHICRETESYICKTSTRFMNLVEEKYALSKDIYHLSLYEVVNRWTTIVHLSLYKYAFAIEESHNVINIISEKLGLLITEIFFSIVPESSYKAFKYNLLQVLSWNVSMKIDIKEKIYIEFLHRPEYKSILENIISLVYNSEVIEVVEEYKQATIIVSDNRPVDNDKEYFYFSNVFSPDDWFKLEEYLNRTISNILVSKLNNTKV
ncbi:hypothetical protein P785_1784 [Enterococcus faecalis KS19]|nr:hypothetical protein P785_1784 [Enterococcus faecalis KS19]